MAAVTDMPILTYGTRRLYYRHWSADLAWAQLLLLHGFGEHTGHYHRLAAHLNTAGIDVWAPDHIGHGHTGGTPGMFDSVDDLATAGQEVLDLMERTNPTLPTVVVGHSLGAVTGALLVIQNPDRFRGLVMTGAPLWGLPETLDTSGELVMSREESYLDALEHDPLGFDTAPAEPNLWRAVDQAAQNIRARLPLVTLPILMIYGEHDVFSSTEDAASFANGLPAAELVVIEGGFHDIPNDVAHRRVGGLISDAALTWSAARPAVEPT